MKVSIIIPVYNEEITIKDVLKKVVAVNFGIEKEVIVVNDGSTDLTDKKIKELNFSCLKKISYKDNRGKGYAIRKGISESTGEIIAIQDADLEYDLLDLKKLVSILIEKKLKVVYGSRFLSKNKEYTKNSFYFANRILSWITSVLYFKKITDMETCYKVFKKDVLDYAELSCDRFDIEPEITSKILKQKIRIFEVPIKYKPRTSKEGKKIKWADGLTAMKVLVRERFNL